MTDTPCVHCGHKIIKLYDGPTDATGCTKYRCSGCWRVPGTPHRCKKNQLRRIRTDAIGQRCMQCAQCKSVWTLEYRSNRLMGIYRNGVRQENE